METISEPQATAAATSADVGSTESPRETLFNSVDITSLIRGNLTRHDARHADTATNLTGHEGWGPDVCIGLDDVLRSISRTESDGQGQANFDPRSIHTIDAGPASNHESGGQNANQRHNGNAVFVTRMLPPGMSNETACYMDTLPVKKLGGGSERERGSDGLTSMFTSLDEICKACPRLRQMINVPIYDRHSKESQGTTCTIEFTPQSHVAYCLVDRTPASPVQRDAYGPDEPILHLPVHPGSFRLIPSYRYSSSQYDENQPWREQPTLAEEFKRFPPRYHTLSSGQDNCSDFIGEVLSERLLSQREAHGTLPNQVRLLHQFSLKDLQCCVEKITSAQQDLENKTISLNCSGARLVGDLFSPEADPFWNAAAHVPYMTLPASSIVASREDAASHKSITLRSIPTYIGQSQVIDFEVENSAFENAPWRLPPPHELLQSVSGSGAYPARRCRLVLKSGSTQQSKRLLLQYNAALRRGYMYLDRRYEGDQVSIEEGEWWMDSGETREDSIVPSDGTIWKDLKRWVRHGGGSE